MKTGRLLKFDRPAGVVQAYLYREAGTCHAAVYVSQSGAASEQPAHTFRGTSDADVEAQVRAWVDARFPRSP